MITCGVDCPLCKAKMDNNKFRVGEVVQLSRMARDIYDTKTSTILGINVNGSYIIKIKGGETIRIGSFSLIKIKQKETKRKWI